MQRGTCDKRRFRRPNNRIYLALGGGETAVNKTICFRQSARAVARGREKIRRIDFRQVDFHCDKGIRRRRRRLARAAPNSTWNW